MQLMLVVIIIIHRQAVIVISLNVMNLRVGMDHFITLHRWHLGSYRGLG